MSERKKHDIQILNQVCAMICVLFFFTQRWLQMPSKVYKLQNFPKTQFMKCQKSLLGGTSKEYCTCAIRGVSYLNRTIRSTYTIMVIVYRRPQFSKVISKYIMFHLKENHQYKMSLQIDFLGFHFQKLLSLKEGASMTFV